jgi:hypothetical protein
MKATFDLPDDLIREIKLRAVHEGRKLKDVATDLLKRGLAHNAGVSPPSVHQPRIQIQSNGLPIVQCDGNAPAGRMNVRQLLKLEKEALTKEDLQRVGHSL